MVYKAFTCKMERWERTNCILYIHIYIYEESVKGKGPTLAQGSLFFSIQFFKFIYFNWRLIALKYCVGFCHTLTWISHGCTVFKEHYLFCSFPVHPFLCRIVSSDLSHLCDCDQTSRKGREKKSNQLLYWRS